MNYTHKYIATHTTPNLRPQALSPNPSTYLLRKAPGSKANIPSVSLPFSHTTSTYKNGIVGKLLTVYQQVSTTRALPSILEIELR